MKKIIFSFLILIFSTLAFAQDKDPYQRQHCGHKKKQCENRVGCDAFSGECKDICSSQGCAAGARCCWQY